MMNRLFGFAAGLMCGALVGATAVLLLTPASGAELRADARARWEYALAEGRQAKEAKQRELDAQFQRMKEGLPL